MNQLGIFAKTFDGSSPAEVLQAVKAAGYGCAQFNLVCVGLDPVPVEVPPEVCSSIADAAREAGVALVALSGTVNMIHPDQAVRAEGRRRLSGVIAAAAACRIPMVTLCTGTRDPDDPWRAHPDNAGPEAWRDLLTEMEFAMAVADRHNIVLGIEPEAGNVVADALAARRLIDELASTRIRVVLDPANLVDGVPPHHAISTVAAAIELLADRISLAHAKDRDADGAPVAPGHGIVDFPSFFRQLAAVSFTGPVVAHGFAAADALTVRTFLENAMGQAGSGS